MKYRTIVQTMLALSGVALGAAANAATPSGEMLGNTCAGCHGTDGISTGPAIPTIGGLSNDYLVDAMMEYKTGERGSTIMTRIAKGYTDDEIKAMSKFFSGKPYVGNKQKVSAKMAKTGAKLHKKYCEKCHEDGGTSAEDDAGVLAGQWKPYLQYTMEDFHSGARTMPKKMKKKMKAMMDKHGAKGEQALLDYYAGQE